MFGNEIDEAIQELEEFQKSLAQIESNGGREAVAIEKARAQAAQITEQLRQLKDSGLVAASSENAG